MATITCTMCGHRFDPAAQVACRSCPLKNGCLLICCPACGFEMVDPNRSILARLAKRWLLPTKDYTTTDSSQRS